jgi:hypothetical protein
MPVQLEVAVLATGARGRACRLQAGTFSEAELALARQLLVESS